MFTCAGFRVKKWPWIEGFHVDSSWDDVEDIVDDVLPSNGVFANEMGLLEFTKENSYRRLLDFAKGNPLINIIAVGIADVSYSYLQEVGRVGAGLSLFDSSEYSLLGYDLIDAHGLFTCLNHPVLLRKRRTEEIFPANEMSLAQNYQELASYVARDHAPYFLAAVFSLKPTGG